MTTINKFFDRILIWNNGCWIWTAGVSSEGHGLFYADGKMVRAARWAYEKWIGAISSDKEIHHKCCITSCVNPLHLEQLTCAEHLNISNNWSGNKTHCINGHKLSKENIYYKPNNSDKLWRECKACRKIKNKGYYKTRMEAVQ